MELLSKLNSPVQSRWTTIWATTAFRRLQERSRSFVDDMSNWYVRRSRERFWAKGMEQDKINAYMTLTPHW